MNLLIAGLILLSQGLTEPIELAAILEGEAGVCGIYGMATVANVYQNNSRMNGRAVPREWSLKTAFNWRDYDKAEGHYIFSHRDMLNPAVLELKAELHITDAIKCAGDDWLFVYAR